MTDRHARGHDRLMNDSRRSVAASRVLLDRLHRAAFIRDVVVRTHATIEASRDAIRSVTRVRPGDSDLL